MAKTDFETVDDYIASQPKTVRPVLERVRSAIRKAVPDADEVISYQIAAYKLEKKTVIFFAGFQEHYSLYPANVELVKAFAKELAPYEVSGKGTIRFPLSKPVPTKLIERIAKFRAKQVATAKATRKSVKKRASRF